MKTALQLECSSSVNIGGTILHQAAHGQAANIKDCTGTIAYAQTIFGQPSPDLNIRCVLRDNGDTINGLPVDSDQVLACIGRRISVDAR